MSHECEDCGRSFETLTRLRLHDCVDGGDAGSTDPDAPGSGAGATRYEPSVEAIDEPLERLSAGDRDAVHEAVAAYEVAMDSALDRGDDVYRDVFWPYYERVSDALDEAARAEGWPLLAQVVDAYDPAAEERLPLATPAIANAVGRYLIRTRLADGVGAIEPAALEYLDAVATNAADHEDVAMEETHAYGWGIGHPDYALVDRLHERVEVDIFSVNPALEHAFYADQHTAVGALEELASATADVGSLSHHREGTVSHGRFLLDAVYGPATEGYWPTTPRYYDWHEEFDYTFELDSAVEERVRDLVVELGINEQLPQDWTLRDLAF